MPSTSSGSSLAVRVARPAEARLEARRGVRRAPARIEHSASSDTSRSVASRSARPAMSRHAIRAISTCRVRRSAVIACASVRPGETEACLDDRRSVERLGVARGARSETPASAAGRAARSRSRARPRADSLASAARRQHDVEIGEPRGDAFVAARERGGQIGRAEQFHGGSTRAGWSPCRRRRQIGGRRHVEPLLAGSGIDRAVVVRAERDLAGRVVFGSRV